MLDEGSCVDYVGAVFDLFEDLVLELRSKVGIRLSILVVHFHCHLKLGHFFADTGEHLCLTTASEGFEQLDGGLVVDVDLEGVFGPWRALC